MKFAEILKPNLNTVGGITIIDSDSDSLKEQEATKDGQFSILRGPVKDYAQSQCQKCLSEKEFLSVYLPVLSFSIQIPDG